MRLLWCCSIVAQRLKQQRLVQERLVPPHLVHSAAGVRKSRRTQNFVQIEAGLHRNHIKLHEKLYTYTYLHAKQLPMHRKEGEIE